MRTPELSGIAIVANGAFNPAIVQPAWLADKELIPLSAAEDAISKRSEATMLVSPQVTSFVADWLTVQVTQEQLILGTVDQGRELDIRDLAKGLFDLLPETPVDALGINADSHFRTDTEAEWHAFGDKFLPKEFWEPLFDGPRWKPRSSDGKHVGMRRMTVESHRNDDLAPGFVRVELAPSVRISPNGIYVGINAHFGLTTKEHRGNARDASRVLTSNWETTRALDAQLLSALMEAI